MATIEKIYSKKDRSRITSYRITVACGSDGAGNQIRQRMSWKPPKPDMTPKQIEKAIAKGVEPSPRVALMGLWDAVSSQHDFYRGFFNGLKSPIVDRIRHAMATDERRELFPVMHYLPNDEIRQVWFPGVHSEVGGGYANDKSLYRLSLNWMIQEAISAGLQIPVKNTKVKVNWLALPKHRPPTSRDYAVRCYWPQDELDGSLLERATATFRPVEFDNFESDNINIRL